MRGEFVDVSGVRLYYYAAGTRGRGDSRLVRPVAGAHVGRVDREEEVAAGPGRQVVGELDADGPVTLVSPDQIATGDHLAYDRGDNKVHLTGNVTWTQGETVVKVDHLVYDLTTKEAHVLASDSSGKDGGAGQGQRIHSMFTPKNK